MLFGAALTLSLAPSDAWWFAPYCLAGLFVLLRGARARLRLACGLCFGIGWFAAGMWWLLPALLRYSSTGWPLALALCAALLLYLGAFSAAAAWACGHRALAAAPVWLRVPAGAGLWTLGEWARGTLFGGMPFLTSGYAHAPGPLAGYAPLAGVYGLAYLNACCALVLAACMPAQATLPMAPQRRARAALTAVLVLALLLGAGQALRATSWTQTDGRTLSVRLLQGNLPPRDGEPVQAVRAAMERYSTLASDSRADLTVLPETALPIEWHSMPAPMRDVWRRIARERGTSVLMGAALTVPPQPGRMGETSNSAMLLTPHEGLHAVQRYDKSALVPFAEFVPPGAEWLAHRMRLDNGAMLPGVHSPAPLHLPQGRIGIVICFESLFDIATARKAAQADVLVSLSNFDWGAGSYAAAQLAQAGQLRALENGRWFVQVAQTGWTMLVDPHGRIADRLPADATGVLDGRVALYTGMTPFARFGNAPLLTLCAASALWLLWQIAVAMLSGASALARRNISA